MVYVLTLGVYSILMVNVTIYSIHGSYGYGDNIFIIFHHKSKHPLSLTNQNRIFSVCSPDFASASASTSTDQPGFIRHKKFVVPSAHHFICLLKALMTWEIPKKSQKGGLNLGASSSNCRNFLWIFHGNMGNISYFTNLNLKAIWG